MSEPLSALEPLYTAAEMKAAEEGHNVEVLMERAGRAVAGSPPSSCARTGGRSGPSETPTS
jgi:NAD(P)H-hydrate repair Nnr-like enzyme with NAD(P)H-hydrate epimerase domain